MNLLPKSTKEFSSAEYWETFFKKQGGNTFEWYGTYVDHCAVLHKYIKPKDKVLVVGCGNSELSERMYDVGYQSITNIDISEVAINQMKERNAVRRPAMVFTKMDMMQMEFSDSWFQVVLDKGTLDAIMTDESEATLHNVERMFGEIGRVLQVGGRFLCISLAQEHIAKKAVSYFSQEGWLVRIHTIKEQSEASGKFALPVFIFVFTKFKKLPGAGQRILEVCMEEQEKPLRLESVQQLLESVKWQQQYALLRKHLSKGSSSRENMSLTLSDRESGKPRYTFYVVDQPSGKPTRANNFAIFIVSAQKKKKKDKRRDWSCLETEKSLGPKPGQDIDKSYLCCNHHRAMIAGLALLNKEGGVLAEAVISMLVVGLGGGSLPLFLHDFFSQSTVDCIEIDPEMLEVATKWFEFSQDDRMRVIVADGLHHMCTLADNGSYSYDVVMFDVDSKDATLGMSCPPPAFVDKAFLQKVQRLMAPQGLFILNLVCRDPALRKKVIAAIKSVFPLVYLQKIEDEVNEILYCQLSMELKTGSKDLLEAGQMLEKTLKKPGKHWDQTYRLAKMLEKITII
ncbi:eEF1A lysine and N-terminal methyltransferase isoform X2 [Narcine bancroftii]|uniref:eEF1A lysine and N-terminal methyltransferase isoform X2 n=1 Tax=Narcine bancroftii TaxID=1343680 RepID=UPI0038319F32